MAKRTIRERVWQSIAIRDDAAFLRAEFKAFGDPSQVTRALKALVEEGRLVKVGHGVYVKAKTSSISGNPVPSRSLTEIGEAFLKKRGITPGPGSSARDYNEGRTTQIPMRPVLFTNGRRLTRRIQVGNSVLKYETTR